MHSNNQPFHVDVWEGAQRTASPPQREKLTDQPTNQPTGHATLAWAWLGTLLTDEGVGPRSGYALLTDEGVGPRSGYAFLTDECHQVPLDHSVHMGPQVFMWRRSNSQCVLRVVHLFVDSLFSYGECR